MAAAPRPLPDMPSSPTLVGREAELDVLRNCLAGCISGQGRLVLVSGEAGIGKTALVQALVNKANDQPVVVLSGQCYDLSATPPYGPWRELIQRYQAADVVPAAPLLTSDTAATDAPENQDALFRAMLEFCTFLASRQPLLLVLEDLHWSDQASLELLRFISRSIGDHRILVIVTYRDDEVNRDHPLFRLLPSLIRESPAERVGLRPLSEHAIRDLVDQQWSLAPGDSDSLVTHLLTRGDGNPLFIVEILRTLRHEGVLEREGHGWRLGDLGRASVPALIQQILESRITWLSDSSRSALQLAAVIGENVSLAQWERLADEDAVAAAVEEGIETQLLVESPVADTVGFRHALMREVIYRSLPLPQRRKLHVKIAEASLEVPKPDPEGVAYHFQQARDPRAVPWLLNAGERAERSFAWAEAIDRYDAAVDMIQRDGVAQNVAGPLLRIGQLLRFTAPDRGMAYLRSAHQAAIEEGEDALAMHALFHIGQMDFANGNQRTGVQAMQTAVEALSAPHQETEGLIRWALQLLPGDARTYPMEILTGTLTLYLAVLGRYEEAVTAFERGLVFDWRDAAAGDQFARILDQTRGCHDGLHGLAFALAGLGRPDESRLAYELAAEHFRRLQFSPLSMLVAHSTLSTLLYSYQARDLEARNHVLGNLGGWLRQLDERLQPVESWMLEYPLLLGGRWTELRQVIASNPITSTPVSVPRLVFRDFAVRARARFAWYQGRCSDAWGLISQMFPDGPVSEPGGHVHVCATEVQRVAAALSISAGDYSLARQWLETHDRWLEFSAAATGRAEGLLLWGQLNLAEANVSQAEQFAELASHQASEPEQPMALIAIQRFLGELAMRRGDHGAANQHLQRSHELAEACALPFERIQNVLTQAELDVERGRESDARVRLAEVRQAAAVLGAEPILERVTELFARTGPRLREEQFGLTARELDVLRLLVQGMTDREIADELFISRHTVMNHVSSILRKLNVDSRTAAATIAVRNGLV